MAYDLLAEITQDTHLKRTSSSRGGSNTTDHVPGAGDWIASGYSPNYGTYGFFACNQCGRSGTAIDFLMLKRGLSKQQALATVGWKPKDGKSLSETIPRYARQSHPDGRNHRSSGNEPQWPFTRLANSRCGRK